MKKIVIGNNLTWLLEKIKAMQTVEAEIPASENTEEKAQEEKSLALAKKPDGSTYGPYARNRKWMRSFISKNGARKRNKGGSREGFRSRPAHGFPEGIGVN